MNNMNDWGLLPATIIAQITEREWHNPANLRGRLTGERPFPLRLSLKAPTGAQALTDLQHFQNFIRHWQAWSQPQQVQWQRKKYQRLGEQSIPVALQLNSMQELITLLGPKAESRRKRWEQLMHPLLALDRRLSKALVRHLATLESMTLNDIELLVQLLPQLQAGIGQGSYLRALALQDVDTKFVETYQALLLDMLDSLYEGAVTAQGGLLKWLDCCENPSGWLLVRPLCQ